MRVAVLSIHDLNDNRISKHIRTLLKNNVEVIYINASNSVIEDFPLVDQVKLFHIPISFVKKSGIKLLKIYQFMNESIKSMDVDILHIHDPQLLCLTKMAKKHAKKIVYDRHEMYETFPYLTAKLGTLFEKLYNKNIDGVIYTVLRQEEYLQRIFKKVRVLIPNYQSVEMFDKAKKNYINEKDKIKFVYIGSLSENDRNIYLMLDIMKDILEKDKRVEFVLGGKTSDTMLQKKIQELIEKQSGFSFKGSMKYIEVVKETVNADIGLLFFKETQNNTGSSSNKLYEYFMAGIAVVAMGAFMNSSDIKSRNAGLLFDYQESKEVMLTKIEDFISNREQIEQCKNNSAKLGKIFQWEEVENNYIKLYQELLCL